MAILHIQLDIDSDVLPELHAVLSGISKNLSRAERLRQLASAGLIWEHLRVHTNATASGVAKSLIGVPLAEAEAALDLPAVADAAINATAINASVARPPAAGGTTPLPRAMFAPAAPAPTDTMLDLALDLEGAPATADGERAAPRQPVPPRFVPVLHDVVESAEPVKAPARREGAARTRAAAVREPVTEAPVEVPEGAPPSGAPPDDTPPPARKSGARSRLIRMQEKGLFKNG